MSSFNLVRCLTEACWNYNLFRKPTASVIFLPHISQQREFRKHINPKFRKERAKKVIKIQLPDFEEQRRDEKLSLEEMRSKLKEKGIVPPREWSEKPIFVSCTANVIDPYVPPEGDGKMSVVTGPGAKQVYETIGKKGKSYMALRKIRNIDYEFDVPTVAQKVQDIYIEAQNALAARDEDRLHDLVTEKAFPEMIENTKNKTIVWKFIQQLEAPRIVHIRTTELVNKSNIFAQVTCRLHTQQILAIYDRFGRLMHGSEDTVKDVLEYVVLEKHITLPHGSWKLHAKIIPDWMPPKEPIKKTYYLPDVDKDFPEPPPSKSIKETDSSSGESNVTAIPA
ncbi:probable 39S ribosomal protein L45, mitochondrial [Argiope bruennichi]|uniref:probable 39S ribosomal protein L45, mitochondrial n=1 Tax=Argiope bruennichi TaxID=94029 RepID=UPI00249443B4|nr:probable 39S ribosomal protein L45, mitochondrial [Argiope bruennichi]